MRIRLKAHPPRRFQFTLQSLLAAMLFVAVSCGLVGGFGVLIVCGFLAVCFILREVGERFGPGMGLVAFFSLVALSIVLVDAVSVYLQ